MSSPTFDCTACGACCFGGHDRYVALLPEDRGRPIPEAATQVIDGRRYMKMACGHCAQLTITPEGQTLCAICDDRPEACRAFRAGSFECLKARQHRGGQVAAARAIVAAAAAMPLLPPAPADGDIPLASIASAISSSMPPPGAQAADPHNFSKG